MLLADRPLPSKQYTKNNEKSYRDCHVIMIVLSTTILSDIYMSFSTIYKFKYPISDHNHKIFKDSLSSDKKRLLGQIRQLSTDSTIANGRFHKPPFIIKRSVSFFQIMINLMIILLRWKWCLKPQKNSASCVVSA